MEPYYVLSDSSNDSDNILSFAERVKLLKNTEKTESETKNKLEEKIIYSKSSSNDRRSLIHSISDSEESDIEKNAVFLRKSPTQILSKDKENDGVKEFSISSDDCDLPDLDFLPPVASLNDAIAAKRVLEVNTLSSSDDDESPKKLMQVKKCVRKAKKDGSKDFEKEKRKQEREEKKKQKELEKALRESEKEILSSQKPSECIKAMRLIIDHNLLSYEESQELFNILDASNIQHGIEENIVKNAVIWYRTVISVSLDNDQLVKKEREELESALVLFIPNENFLNMLYASFQRSKGQISEQLPLSDFIVNIKSLCTDANITCITIGFDKFMRSLKDGGSVELKALAKKLPKNALEQTVVELQLQTYINFHFLNSMSEFGNLLTQFTKAIAEAPFKKEKQDQKSSAFSWYADMDSSCPVKLDKEPASYIKLWRQQVQQFQNVGPEMAEAIISLYPSPRLLLEAYSQCSSSKEAENLLQDIVVRRNYGPLGTQKRIGPELSFKMYRFLTSSDGSQLLKR